MTATPITWTDVTDYMPVLSSIKTSQRTIILDIVNNESLNPTMFGGEDTSRFKQARIYLAAHMAIIARTSATGGVGPVTSQSAGGISRSYAQSSDAGSSSWASTGPGRLLLELCYEARGPHAL